MLPTGRIRQPVLTLLETERLAIQYAFETYPGTSTKYIAKRLQCPVSTLYRLLNRHGLQHLKTKQRPAGRKKSFL